MTPDIEVEADKWEEKQAARKEINEIEEQDEIDNVEDTLDAQRGKRDLSEELMTPTPGSAAFEAMFDPME